MYLGLNALLRASGHPQKAMTATITTVIINTILDPKMCIRDRCAVGISVHHCFCLCQFGLEGCGVVLEIGRAHV